MGWKEYILERFRIKERNVSVADRKAEEAIDRGDNERAKAERHRASRNECYIEGMLDVLESIGYTIKFDDDGDIKDILGEYSTEYRVRYKHFELENYVFCDAREKIQEIIDRAKKLDIEIPGEYTLVGIDDRIVYPNGEVGEWNKIFDF